MLSVEVAEIDEARNTHNEKKVGVQRRMVSQLAQSTTSQSVRSSKDQSSSLSLVPEATASSTPATTLGQSGGSLRPISDVRRWAPG